MRQTSSRSSKRFRISTRIFSNNSKRTSSPGRQATTAPAARLPQTNNVVFNALLGAALVVSLSGCPSAPTKSEAELQGLPSPAADVQQSLSGTLFVEHEN